ncbi:hypothetical protein C8J56DRAFT_803313, partial [Mycena floridula]
MTLGKLPGSEFTTVISSRPKTRGSVFNGTYGVHRGSSHARLDLHTSTNAPSVVSAPTTPSRGSAVGDPVNRFLSISDPPSLVYHDFTDSIHLRPTFNPSLHIFPEVFSRIHQPYSVSAFQSFLVKHNLTQQYSLLANNLTRGFPL